MANKIKTTGDFFADLILGLRFPERVSENQLVRFMLGFSEERFVKLGGTTKIDPEKTLREDVNAVNQVPKGCTLVPTFDSGRTGGRFKFPEKHILFEDILIRRAATLRPEYCLKVMHW
jgi:hypothetical protein